MPAVCRPQSDIPVQLLKHKHAFVIKSPTKLPTAYARPAKTGCLRMWSGVYEWNVPLSSSSLLAIEEIVGPLVDSLFSSRMGQCPGGRYGVRTFRPVDLHSNPERSVGRRPNKHKQERPPICLLPLSPSAHRPDPTLARQSLAMASVQVRFSLTSALPSALMYSPRVTRCLRRR